MILFAYIDHMLRSWGSDFNTGILGRHNSTHNIYHPDSRLIEKLLSLLVSRCQELYSQMSQYSCISTADVHKAEKSRGNLLVLLIPSRMLTQVLQAF
jgi:hypothetical protein